MHDVLCKGMEKGNSKVSEIQKEGACNSAPNEPKDLKFLHARIFYAFIVIFVQAKVT